jgi:hypothetical protein
VSAGSGLAPDAAMVLGIAATAMPFARTRQDEAERWLRVLRLHGEVGATLQALGVSEGSLPANDEDTAGRHVASPESGERSAASEGNPHSASPDADERDVVARVSELAAQKAAERGVAGVTTTDVLAAVMQVYGADFDTVLRAHGTDSDEVTRRLAG